MNASLRSKHGCWTCKLRRKKCDETHPLCWACESLSIPCYGFGLKPEWMDNGENERAVLNSLKEIVKRTSRRKAAPQLPKKWNGVIKIAPKLSENDSEDSSTGSGLQPQIADGLPQSDHAPLDELGPVTRQDESTAPASPKHDDPTVKANLPTSAEESVLLMDFLDNIFPLQYPMFKPSLLQGGRGWLLSHLLQTEPLYYAALAFSTYHRRILISVGNVGLPQAAAAVVQQEKYAGRCIAFMNESAQMRCGKWNVLGIALTVVELVFFELFTENTDAWQAHLRALVGMGLQAHEQQFDGRFRLTEPAKQILREDRPVTDGEATVAEEVACFRFIKGTTAWLDIIYAITAGKAPVLQPHLSSILTSDSQLQLGDIMGCRNNVMLLIARIATYYEQKVLAVRGRPLCSAIGQSVADIAVEIQQCLTEGAFEHLYLSGCNSTGVSNEIPDERAVVTHVFSQMALLYLHVVTQGFQNLELQGAVISNIKDILQTQVSRSLLPAMTLPLFIIGTAADHGDQDFFRGVFSHPPLLDPTLKHRAKILPILEEVWKRRRILERFEWSDCLELTSDILLL